MEHIKFEVGVHLLECAISSNMMNQRKTTEYPKSRMPFWVQTLQSANCSFFLNPCQPESVADPWPCWIFHYPTNWSSGQLGSMKCIMFSASKGSRQPPPSWPFVKNLGFFPHWTWFPDTKTPDAWTCWNLQIPFLPPRAVSPNIDQPFDSLVKGFDRNINWLFQ